MENVLAHIDHARCNHDLHPCKHPYIFHQNPAPVDSSVVSPSVSIEEETPPISSSSESTLITSVTHPLLSSESHHQTKAAVRLMQKAWTTVPSYISTVRVHIDGGANRSITHLREHLLSYRNIKKYPMSGVAAGDAALVCTGIGYLPWQANTGEVILVKCYYSSDAADTIISPTDIVVNCHDYDAWEQYSHIATGKGYIKFHRRDGTSDVTYHLTMSNGLWFHNNTNDTTDFATWTSRHMVGKPIIHRIHKNAEYHLAHFRYGCPGQRTLSIVHLHVDNQPKLQKHDFFACLACMLATGDCRDTTDTGYTLQPALFDDWFNDSNDTTLEVCDPGQHFQVDFGFMKGSGYCKKDEEGRTITSIDGFRSYFLIIDRKTRYVWVFLTKTKKPPLNIFAQFLKEHGHPTAPNRTIRSDRGGELWGSQAFKDVVHQAGYIMDPTAPFAAFQNGKAERPNRNFGKTVRCLLYNANLGPEYWSFAVLHAVYLKNRIPHCATNQVPLTAYSGKRPNAKRLRIFGCPIVVRHVDRKAKLDLNTSAGIFLGYTATDKNVVYRDSVTGRFKTATHVVFNEAGMTLPAAERSPAAKVLQDLGYGTTPDSALNDASTENDASTHDIVPVESIDPHHPSPLIQPPPILPQAISDCQLQVKLLSVHASLPVRATDGSAGYDVFSAVDKVIPPKTRCAIPLDIAITSPSGSYVQILSRSGMSLKYHVDVRAGTIDRDYTGNVQVLLENSGDNPFTIKIGDRIAQLVLIDIQTPPILQTDALSDTTRGDNGFGSTGVNLHTTQTPNPSISSSPRPVTPTEDMISPGTGTVHNLSAEPIPIAPQQPMSSPVERPYGIYFSTDPFDDTVEIDVPIKGDHPTLGILSEYCDARQRLQVTDMAISTPGSRLKSWRTVIRKSYMILKFNDFAIQNKQDLEHAMSQTRSRKMLKAKLVIATDKSYGVHPMEGILQIHFDQLNVIAKLLEEIKKEEDIK